MTQMHSLLLRSLKLNPLPHTLLTHQITWRGLRLTPAVLFRGPKYRVRNEDKDLPLASSDDEDRQPRKYVFVSDDDERLFEGSGMEEKDDAAFYAPLKEDPVEAELWAHVDRINERPLCDPEKHFAEWKAKAKENEKVDTHGLAWARTALEISRTLLASPPLDLLSLHGFNVSTSRRKIHVTLDKYVDPHGSPSLEEIANFTERLHEGMDDALGAAVVDSLQFEVSTPGAERSVRHTFELDRFQHLPMKVVYYQPDDRSNRSKTSTKILEFLRHDPEDVSVWRYWDGKYNRKAQIRKSDFDREWAIPLRDIISIHLFLDI